MIERALEGRLRESAKYMPVTSLTGPRQSGKSTLLKTCFPDFAYVNLENPLELARATDDPLGFLEDIEYPVIIDEAQRFPELFSYIQIKVDEINKPGMYFLSGSQNFLMMESISQSLAGRVSVLRLYPLTASELSRARGERLEADEWMFSGSYPRVYDMKIPATDFYPSYIETYLERDVRSLRAVSNLADFSRFMRVLAGRVGQTLVVTEIANDSDLSMNTVKDWLSLLEAGYIITLLRPFHRNVTSRNVKSPKLYFWDTGLVCSLLGITSKEQIATHYMKGNLFENMLVSELLKGLSNSGDMRPVSFWKNNKGKEVDFILENREGGVEAAVEIKTSMSPKLSHFGTLDILGKHLELGFEKRFVAYGGSEFQRINNRGSFVPWQDISCKLGIIS